MKFDTDVLIVGAGPAGLSCALALSTYGIDATVVTKHRSLSPTPRAHVTNQRTFEILRDLGLEADARLFATDYAEMPNVDYCASLAGEEFARTHPFGTGPARAGDYGAASPCSHADLAQNLFEPILFRHALARGADVRFSTEYVGLEQDSGSVRTMLADRVSGEAIEVRSEYVIGADGGNSKVAADVGLPFEGKERIGHSINILFESDLGEYVEHRPAFLYNMLAKPNGPDDLGLSVLRPTRRWTQWLLTPVYNMASGELKLTEADAIAVVRERIGVADLPVRIKAIDPWDIHSLHATRYSAGRVFCAGDAVHRHSPANGLGSNTAVQDAYNLAWKMALVLKDKAGPGLLDTYDQERVPVGRAVVDRATRSLAITGPIIEILYPAPDAGRSDDDAPRDPGTREARLHDAVAQDRFNMNTHGVEMNQDYSSAAVIPDGSDAPKADRDQELFYTPSTRPGRHLPHAWVERDGRRISTLDLVGRGGFALITGLGGEAWTTAAAAAAETFGVPVAAHMIGQGAEVVDPWGDWQRLREIDASGCILVRPDGYVCFREHAVTAECGRRIAGVLAKILGKAPRAT